MINLTHIKIAVNNMLNNEFAPLIRVISQDVKKGFQRPSFTTEITESKIEMLESQIETSCNVTIYYFSDLNDTENSISVLEMQWHLHTLFGNKLKVADRALNIIEPSSDYGDGILVFEFDILFYQASDSQSSSHNPNAELMQELDINYKRK